MPDLSVHSIVPFEQNAQEFLQKNLIVTKFECFSGKNLKCFVTDWERGHQRKTAVFQFSCRVLILHSFLYDALNIEILPLKIQESEFITPFHSWVGEIIYIKIKKLQKFLVTIQTR